jgi:hypothetical protein
VPFGPVLLAEVDGRPRAALSVRDGSVIADPFAPTADVVEMLRVQARAMTERASRSSAESHGLLGRLGLAA